MTDLLIGVLVGRCPTPRFFPEQTARRETEGGGRGQRRSRRAADGARSGSRPQLRLCGLHFPRTGLGQRAPRRCPLKGLSRTLKGFASDHYRVSPRTLKGFSKSPPDPWGKGAGWPLHLLYNKGGAKGALMRPGERCQFPRRHEGAQGPGHFTVRRICASLTCPSLAFLEFCDTTVL